MPLHKSGIWSSKSLINVRNLIRNSQSVTGSDAEVHEVEDNVVYSLMLVCMWVTLPSCHAIG